MSRGSAKWRLESSSPGIRVWISYAPLDIRTLSGLTGAISHGGAGHSGTILYCPLQLSGTRHEYEQVKPQPNSNVPVWIVLPLSSSILN
jgi:hypothetical protein